jgi:hypothetical protein
MQQSVLFASLVGPIMIFNAVSILLNRKGFQEVLCGAARNPAVVFVAGMVMSLGGLIVVKLHNQWAMDWTSLITAYGWLTLLGGAARMLFPDRMGMLGEKIAAKPGILAVGAAISAIIGVILTIKGYQTQIPPPIPQ